MRRYKKGRYLFIYKLCHSEPVKSKSVFESRMKAETREAPERTKAKNPLT